jgi:hypothetical protein
MAEALKTMNLEKLDEQETVDQRPLLPWRAESTEIEVRSDREMASERAETVRSISAIVVYPDAPGRECHLVAAVIALDHNLQVIEPQQVQVGTMDCSS